LENLEKKIGQSGRIQLEDGTSMQWAPVVRTKRKDALTTDVDAMVKFWTNETTVSPNKWDVMYILPNFFNLILSTIVLFFVSTCCIVYGYSWGLDIWL
jgi:hypothetical protein